MRGRGVGFDFHNHSLPYPSHFFQEDIEQAYQKLAEEIVQKLFYQNPTTSPATIDTTGFVSETHLIAQP